MKTPTVLSKTFVTKYHKHSSEFCLSYESAKEIVRFMKWAINCDIICLEASKVQIFQGLFGC